MKRDRTRSLLWIIAAAMLASLALFLVDRPYEEPLPMPGNTLSLAQRLAIHPTDWRAASALVEHELDSSDPQRLEAWRQAYALASGLAPHFELPRRALAGSGFFHWYELSEPDRKRVLGAVEPLMHDPLFYSRVGHPLFELTGDLRWLRHSHPDDDTSLRDLRDLAVMFGLFQDYRELRTEERHKALATFVRQAPSLPPSEIIQRLPPNPHTEDEPLIASALRELHTRPLEVNSNRTDIVDGVIGYSVRHRLQPLDGLAAVVTEPSWASRPARAQLARALGQVSLADELDPAPHPQPALLAAASRMPVWTDLCGTVICLSSRATVTGPYPIALEPVASDEVPPYVEVYVDDARVAEGPLVKRETVATVPDGQHRVEVRIANPVTRNRGRRTVRAV